MYCYRLFLFSILSFLSLQSAYVMPLFHVPGGRMPASNDPIVKIVLDAEQGRLEGVIWCLSQLDPNIPEHYKAIHRALIQACFQKQVDTIMYFLTQPYIDINFQDSPNSPYPLIAIATKNYNEKLIILLLNHNANWLLKGPHGMTALQAPGGTIIQEWIKHYKDIIWKAIDDRDFNTLISLLKHKGMQRITDDQGNTALHSAILKNKRMVIKAILLVAPELVGVKNNDNLTCLELAIKQRDISLTVMLLSSNPEACEPENLIFALANDSFNMAKLLVKAAQPVQL